VSGSDRDSGDRLTAVDRATGERLFGHALPAALAGAPARVGGRTAVVAPLADGTLRRVGPDGTTAWEVGFGAPLSDATAVAGTVYVGSATEQVIAVDAATGEVRWRGRLANTVFTAPRVVDGTVYVGGADYYLYAFDAADGTRIWRTETANAVTGGPLPVAGRLVTRIGGRLRRRPLAGAVSRTPHRVVVHRQDGTPVASSDADQFVDDGSVEWISGTDGAVYVGQQHRLLRLAGGGLGEA
jgi:outer membrane protein assembly factor BamB